MPDKSTADTVRQNIGQMLEQAGTSLNAFARQSGVPYATLQRLLSTKGDGMSPQLSTLEQIAAGLGVSVSALFQDDAPRAPTPSPTLAKQVGRLVQDFLACPEPVRTQVLHHVERLAAKHSA